MVLYDNLTFVTAEEKLDLFKQLDYTDRIEAEVEMIQYKKQVINELFDGLRKAPSADRPAIARYLRQDPTINKISSSKESIAAIAIGLGAIIGRTLINAYMESLGRIKKILSKDGNFDASDKSGYLPEYDTVVKVLKNCQAMVAALLTGNPEAIIKTYSNIGVKAKYNAQTGAKGLDVKDEDKEVGAEQGQGIISLINGFYAAANTILAGATFGLFTLTAHITVEALSRLANRTAQEKGWTAERHKACAAMVVKLIDGVEKLKSVKAKNIKGADKVFKTALKTVTKTIKYIGRGLASAAN